MDSSITGSNQDPPWLRALIDAGSKVGETVAQQVTGAIGLQGKVAKAVEGTNSGQTAAVNVASGQSWKNWLPWLLAAVGLWFIWRKL